MNYHQKTIRRASNRKKFRRRMVRKSDTVFVTVVLRITIVLVVVLGIFGLNEASRLLTAQTTVTEDVTPTRQAPSIMKAALKTFSNPAPDTSPVHTPVAGNPPVGIAPPGMGSSPHLSENMPATTVIPAPATAPTVSPLLTTNPHLVLALQNGLEQISAAPNNPGMVMHVYIPGQGAWTGASGLSNRELKTPIVPSDRFRIASVTKTFVATVVLQLVQEHVLHLDQTVEQWLPGMVPNGHAITIRHLMSHTSGIYDYLDHRFEQIYFDSPRRVWGPNELVAYGVAHDPYFAPGEPGKWHYSNTNYILLGMIIEKATGTPLHYQLRSRIFEPLQLHNTYLEDYEEMPGGFVHGYIGTGDFTDASLSTWAAGGIISNAEDVATFAQALFTGTLINQAMLHEMLQPVLVDIHTVKGYPVYGLGMTKNIEAFSLITSGAAPNNIKFSALWGHTGGLSGFKSIMGYMPGNGITIVILTNEMTVPTIPVLVQSLNLILGKNQDPAMTISP